MKPARRASRTATRTRLTVDERRRQLLVLGLREFTARLYDEVSTDEIATAAGISRGLLFHYFPTKHDYYVAVLQAAAEELVGKVLAIDELDAPATDRLALGLDA